MVPDRRSDMDDPLVREILSTPALRREDNDALARVVVAGGPDAQRAVDRMVTGNMRLVYRIARKYPDGTLCMRDRIQEGAIGLLRAARKFDPDRGVGFATYASYWIKATIGRSINGSEHLLSIPDNVVAAIRRLRRANASSSRPLSADEIDKVLVMGDRTPAVLSTMSSVVVPLDAPLSVESDYDDDRMSGSIADPEAETPEAMVMQGDVWVALRRCQDLTEREYGMLVLYVGGESYAGIGVRYKLSRERVRQIIDKVVATLRLTIR